MKWKMHVSLTQCLTGFNFAPSSSSLELPGCFSSFISSTPDPSPSTFTSYYEVNNTHTYTPAKCTAPGRVQQVLFGRPGWATGKHGNGLDGVCQQGRVVAFSAPSLPSPPSSIVAGTSACPSHSFLFPPLPAHAEAAVILSIKRLLPAPAFGGGLA